MRAEIKIKSTTAEGEKQEVTIHGKVYTDIEKQAIGKLLMHIEQVVNTEGKIRLHISLE